MALVSVPGSPIIPIGIGPSIASAAPGSTQAIIDAQNEAVLYIGHVLTSDGASHTIDTTGSSSLGWRVGSATFANAGTTVKVGLAAVDTTTGPPGRAANVANVITFDVSRTMVGGGGDINAFVWQTHVPDAGTKTIANGDLVAFAVQMTARGGTDTVGVSYGTSVTTPHMRPIITTYLNAAYSETAMLPNCIITFADGALGYFQASDVGESPNNRVWNSSGATKEYGQLLNLPFPYSIYGAYGWAIPSADFDVVLYSDPLGTPIAQKTASIDANVVGSNNGRKFFVAFASPYSVAKDQSVVIAFKPGGSNITAYYKTFIDAAYRVTDPYGLVGYGVTRATGAFANANSSLDHYYIGLIAGAFEAGGGGRMVQINNDSLVA